MTEYLGDIFDIFEEQHEHLLNQLRQLGEAAEGLLQTRTGGKVQFIVQAFDAVEEQILKHSHAEDRALLPVLDEHLTNSGILDRFRLEHERIEELLHHLREDLHGLPVAGPINRVTLESVNTYTRLLVQLLTDHIAFERNQIFPIAREIMSTEVRARVGRDLAALG